MTRTEFDAWIEKHYTELLKVACRRNQYEPEDVVQQAIAGMLDSAALPTIESPTDVCLCGCPHQIGVWPWAVGFVRGHATSSRTSARRNLALKHETKNIHRAASSLGWKRPAPRAE